MKYVVSDHEYLFSDAQWDFRPFAQTFIASMMLHIILFAIFIFGPELLPRRHTVFEPTVIDVSLVAMPGKKPSGKTLTQNATDKKKGTPKSEKKEEAPKPIKKEMVKEKPQEKVVLEEPPVKKVEPIPVVKETIKPVEPSAEVSLAPKWKKTVQSLKKQTYKPDNAVKSAISEMEKKIGKDQDGSSRSKSVSDAINRFKEKVDEQGEDGAEGGSSGIGDGKDNEGGGQLSQIDMYKLLIQSEVQKNWTFSDQMAGENTKLETIVVIKILPNGEISDIWYDKKSGNSYLDDSAYKAVMKAKLPPLPEGFSHKSFTLGLKFTPEGLQ